MSQIEFVISGRSIIRILLLSFPLLLLVAGRSSGQGTLDDYLRAETVKKSFANKIYNNPQAFRWISNEKFWYVTMGREGKKFILVDAKVRRRSELFNHVKLAGALSNVLQKKILPFQLPFNDVTFSNGSNTIQFTIDSLDCTCDIKRYSCTGKVKGLPTRDERYWGSNFDETKGLEVKSPDSLWVAQIRDFNVVIVNRLTNESHQLSYDGSIGSFYSSYLSWSPDGKKIMAYKVRPGAKREIYFVESSPKDQHQPKLHSRDYLKPGDDLPHRSPQLFLVEERKHIPVSDDLFSNQYFVEEIVWRADSRSFVFEYNERGHQRYRVMEVNARTGEARVLVDEISKTFIDYSSKKFRYDVADGKEIIWASERDGWNHLYRYDGDGKLLNQITKGEWVVRGVEKVDEEQKRIFFTASGLDAGQDPYLLHYCVINFDGSGLRRLTESNANHTAFFSPDYKYFVDYASRVDLPALSTLVEVSSLNQVMKIEESDVTDLLAAGWKTPEVFSAKARDGKTDIWGVIIRPSGFDPNRRYPVLEEIYAGPHGFNVPKVFSAGYSSINGLAELGFVIVMIDGLGTSGRSKAFHDVCWKNLHDAGFEDRILWMKAASKKYPWMDISRVGIFGTSAGGQNAAGAVLFHPEFYSAAVASCGSHDNRMDKIWWNEQWMGHPVGPHYAASSNVVNAHKLKGKLMLMVGEVDDNVDPATTLQVANALIQANKDFDLVVLPGAGHTSGGRFGERKMRDFFVKNLLKVDPPEWDQVYDLQQIE